MENQEEQKTLLREMVEGLTKDVINLIKLLTTKETKPATLPDLQPFLQRVADAIRELREQVRTLTDQKPQPQAQTFDSSELLTEVRAMRQEIRKSPANRISKAVQYGAGLLAASLLLTGVLAYYATKWKEERDTFEVSDWKWRAVRQVDAVYATKVDGIFSTDSTSQPNKIWIIEQEQADATREAARKAAEQAKVMNEQADKLEGKSGLKRGKK